MVSRRASWPGVALLVLCIGAACAVGMRLAETNGLSTREVCLGNLSRLAQATLMYVADNDGEFPPHQTPMDPYECQWGADNSNPWLRWPVLLDDYASDRSIYRCPAVRTPAGHHGVLSHPHWIASERISSKGWPRGPCGSVWPPGWGGAVTDSETQGPCEDPGRFAMGIGGDMRSLGGKRLQEIEHPERHVMWADSSRIWLTLGSVLWASACRADCADVDGKADWENCPWSQECGAAGDFATNPKTREKFTRHEGGSNIAFVDGHVAWMSVEEGIHAYRQGKLLGLEPHARTKGEPWYLK